ncbi:MAG: glycosyltransferase family 2 protein [Chitinispirillaceae bacterium]|nr:glycosyltransferase family 2 protein [Chitinispirillaceae bacterium]
MPEPLVSVVVPTYNRAEVLPRAVNSVLGQTYRHVELIIVNDGSTDATDNAVAPLVISRVRSIRFPENRGGGIARNAGIAEARGEFVAFLDDDDVWLPSKLTMQIDYMTNRGVDLCYTAIRKMYWGKGLRRDRFHATPEANVLKAIMTDNFIGPTSSVVVRKSFIDLIGGFDPFLPALQDWDLYMRLIDTGARVGGLDKVLVEYYKTDKKSVSRSFVYFYEAGTRILSKIKGNPYWRSFRLRFYAIIVKRMLGSDNFRMDFVKTLLGMKR